MKEKITVVKVGGAVVEDPASLSRLIEDFSKIDGRKVLVHGGGRRATAVAAQLGIESQMIGGRRITDEAMLQVATMVYGGLVNKTIVAQLQAAGVDALGLTGADIDVIRSHRRPLTTVTDAQTGERREVDFGFVGDVERANGDKLRTLIEAGITPVMAPLTHDGHGSLLNTNADTIASATATALAAHYDVTLVFCFEKKGVLACADDENSVIPHIDTTLFRHLVADGTVSGGMLPKLENAFAALRAGVQRVNITLDTDIEGQHGTMNNK